MFPVTPSSPLTDLRHESCNRRTSHPLRPADSCFCIETLAFSNETNWCQDILWRARAQAGAGVKGQYAAASKNLLHPKVWPEHWLPRLEGRNKLFVKNQAHDDWAADFWLEFCLCHPFNVSDLADSTFIPFPNSKVEFLLMLSRCWKYPFDFLLLLVSWKPTYSHRFARAQARVLAEVRAFSSKLSHLFCYSFYRMDSLQSNQEVSYGFLYDFLLQPLLEVVRGPLRLCSHRFLSAKAGGRESESEFGALVGADGYGLRAPNLRRYFFVIFFWWFCLKPKPKWWNTEELRHEVHVLRSGCGISGIKLLR